MRPTTPAERSDRTHTVSLRVVIGADIGGTSTRIALVPVEQRTGADAETVGPSLDGAVITRGPGANLRSSGPAAVAGIAAPVREALTVAGETFDRPLDVCAVFAGMSGAGAARHGEILDALRQALTPLGIAADRIDVGPDLLTAFLAGDVGDDGVLLLAGTGAVAVRFTGREITERRDGMGWMLGDIGSAVWLGRRTLEAVAADIDDRGPRTELTERLADALDLDLRDGILPPSPTGDVRQDLIRALDEIVPVGSPAAMGRFAPLPGQIPDDPVARQILDAAIRHLSSAVQRLDPDRELPVVLAGSVLTSPGPIHDELLAGLQTDGRTTAIAADGLAGAVRLAHEAALEDPTADARHG
ncbi:N-acetylglucosamine kinase [Brachybacterium timonense]|uniref:N-acetylglucosamine kinase n=1 Tax=Brachybacterium timonense TaxID=2050896 RepID=UPI000D0AEEDB|nr:BadF/BadG/BcrA/BcrD ATPase family protein [Brachybacterium timonense]